MLSSSVCIVSDHLLISLAYDLGLLQEIQDEIYLGGYRPVHNVIMARPPPLRDGMGQNIGNGKGLHQVSTQGRHLFHFL